MNCLFLLLLLCCCGNRNNNWDCGDSCGNECHSHHHHNNCAWRNSVYNVIPDTDCECDRKRDKDRNCDNERNYDVDRRCDNDRRLDNDCICDDCNDNRREPRIFPPYRNNENCGCND